MERGARCAPVLKEGRGEQKATNKKIVRERSSRDRVCKRVPRDSDRPRVNSKNRANRLDRSGRGASLSLASGNGPRGMEKAAAPTFRSLLG